MSSTANESVIESGVTPSQSEMTPASNVVISTVNVLGEPINQVSFFLSYFDLSSLFCMFLFCFFGFDWFV